MIVQVPVQSEIEEAAITASIGGQSAAALRGHGRPAPWGRVLSGRDRTLVALGAYYLVAGTAPFISRRAFEAVTGPKREWWLVQTVGAIVTVAGGSLLSAVGRRRVTPETVGLAAGCAAALGMIDVVFVTRGRISPVYLADAVIEIGALAGLASGAGDFGRPFADGDGVRPSP